MARSWSPWFAARIEEKRMVQSLEQAGFQRDECWITKCDGPSDLPLVFVQKLTDAGL